MSTNGLMPAGCAPVVASSPVQQAPAPAPSKPAPLPGPSPVPGPPSPPPWTPPTTGQPGQPGQPGPMLPPTGPPQVPPPGFPTVPPTDPAWPPTTPPSKPPTDPVDPPTTPPTDPVDDGFDWKPWLIGAGILGAGVAGAIAIRNGMHNVRALNATAASFESGAMHQGGLAAIHDAGLGARFARGIGFGDKLLVATPGVNRIGDGAKLTAVARGHLDHAELMASATALRRQTGDAVGVHEPLRASVLEALESGRPLPSILDDLDRSADGARPYFTNPRLANYWDNASIVERGPKSAGQHVISAVTVHRPELALDDAKVIVETGGMRPVDQVIAGRGARLGDAGLADGIGSIQAANVDTLPPALRERAIAASGVDPTLVDEIGLRGAYVQRWKDRIALGATTTGAVG